MASPITIHATHPTSHFFWESSTYSEEYQARHLREGVVDPYRAHPYQRERSHSPPKKGIDYRSTRSLSSTIPLPQVRPPSRGQDLMPSHRYMPPQFSASPRSSMHSSESSRIGVDQLVDRFPASSSSASQRGSLQGGPVSTSPVRGLGEHAETARLPGIGSLLGLRPEVQRYDPHQRYPPPPAAPGYAQPRYQGHSAASSMSSAFSEPVSPSSHGGHSSRSPIPQHPHVDDRARAQSQYHYPPPREELYYNHGRTQTLPSVHSQQSHASPYPPPPPPSGPETMLPPPPDPYYHTPNPYNSQRPSHSYGKPHASQLGPSWDRPRFDSAIPMDDQGIAPPGYPWGYPGPHGANSMARKRRGNLPKEATKILKDWFGQHHDSPYPTEDEKQELCRATGLQISQVNNWFINARRRLPREDDKKLLDKEGQERAGTEDSADSDMTNGTLDVGMRC